MIKKIDRYILRQFILTAIFALFAFIMIFVAIDMMENLDDFLDRHATPQIIMLYYLHFIPEIIKLMVPVAMLLSSLFTTGRFSTYSELTALKSGGVSLYRFMVPIMIFSLLVCCTDSVSLSPSVEALNPLKPAIHRWKLAYAGGDGPDTTQIKIEQSKII